MTFTGTLIQNLIATVERAERLREVSVRSGAIEMSSGDLCLLGDSLVSGEPSPINTWFASVEQSANYDPKFIGVA
ncbi:MAG: hypothetical protein ABJA69_09675 [Acidobacteriaceae bacterium]